MTGWQDLTLTVDGRPMAAAAKSALVGLSLSRELNVPAVLELAFADRVELPGFQADLRLVRGDDDLFHGRVLRTTHRDGAGGPRLEILARDDLSRLAERRTPGGHDHTSVRAVLKDAAAGIGAVLTDPGFPDFRLGRHITRDRDDLAGLVRLFERYGIGVSLRPNGLAAVDVTDPGKGVVLEEIAVVTAYREVREPSLSHSSSGWFGWSPDTDKTVGKGDAPGLFQAGVAMRSGETQSRLSAAARSYGLRNAHWVESTLRGLVDLWPGEAIRTDRRDGSALPMQKVTLLLDAAGGARTLISTRPPVPSATVPGSFLTGQVVQADDPAGAGRVTVALNGYPDTVTGWLPTLAQQSRRGGGTGLAVPLDPGDPVLIACPEGDPELGIVLGALVRGSGPGAQVSGGRARTGQVWRGAGATVLIDEERGAIDLALDDGTRLTLDDNRIALKASGGLDLNCDGKVRIRGTRIDFEEA